MLFRIQNLLCDFCLQYPVRSKKCLGTDSSAWNCALPLPPSLPILFFCPALRNPAPHSSAFRNKTPTAILNGKLYGIKPQIILPCSMQINKTKKKKKILWSEVQRENGVRYIISIFLTVFLSRKIYIFIWNISLWKFSIGKHQHRSDIAWDVEMYLL